MFELGERREEPLLLGARLRLHPLQRCLERGLALCISRAVSEAREFL